MNDQDHKKTSVRGTGSKKHSRQRFCWVIQRYQKLEGVNWLHLALNHLDDQLVVITAIWVRFFFCSKTVLVINQLPDFFALCEIRRKLLVLFNTREPTLLESPKLVNAQPYNFGHLWLKKYAKLNEQKTNKFSRSVGNIGVVLPFIFQFYFWSVRIRVRMSVFAPFFHQVLK